jgi:protein O-GlcNAc transferase
MTPRTAAGEAAKNAARSAAAFQRAVNLHRQGRASEADAACCEVLRVDPQHYGAWHLRGLLAIEGRNGEQGMAWIGRSLKIQPEQPAAHCNLGNALLSAGRPQEALASFEQALHLKSDYFAALYNRGNALRELHRLDEALASYDLALRLKNDDAAALSNRKLVILERVHELIRQGDLAQSEHRLAAAIETYDRALVLDPDSPVALLNSGNALMKTGRVEAALARYDKTLRSSPSLVDALINRGAALQELKRHEESVQCFAEVVRVAPGRDYVLGSLFHARLDSCDWTDYGSSVTRLVDAVSAGQRAVNPFTLLLLPLPAMLPLQCTRALVEAEYPPDASLGPIPARKSVGRRIHVAYVSPDFRDHPVSYLLAGVFERLDRDAFQVSAISLRESQKAGIGARLHAAFDRFVEVENRTDQEIAQLLRDMEVDIAVDLTGLTEGLRLGIFAQRAAPVQVSYLGYPGTTGAPYMDYVLADEFVIPAESRPYYAEQVVSLPECFQANDDRCPVSPRPSRAEVGLPDQGLVLCCFNNNYKLNPPLFDVWMRLLREVPGSVLWLLADREGTQRNLLREAAARGVEAGRLVFAGRMPYARHLGRLGLADLFLDTLPYNAGTTASDALRNGVPVLTCVGKLLVSRMAGSLLRTVGLAELITTSLQEYERKALELALHPQRLRELQATLARQLPGSPLFDTTRFCRHLEAAFRAMHRRALDGQPPAHIALPAADGTSHVGR